MVEFSFPVGYHQFHTVKIINFQLNRWHSLGYARFEDLLQAAQRIRTLDDWKGVMVSLAQDTETEQRWMNAAFYYRAAEFFTYCHQTRTKTDSIPSLSIFFIRRFWPEKLIERFLVPYEHAHLPAIRVSSTQPSCRGTIVIHGGFDSYIEEFYSLAVYFSSHGFDIIMFEGPGQGAALKKYGLPLTYQWEKPVKAVLDHFHLDECHPAGDIHGRLAVFPCGCT